MQNREIEKLETFINSENGLNQQKVTDLQNELANDDEMIVHLQQVIKNLIVKVEIDKANNIQKDIELCKKKEDLQDLNVKLVENAMELRNIKKAEKEGKEGNKPDEGETGKEKVQESRGVKERKGKGKVVSGLREKSRKK